MCGTTALSLLHYRGLRVLSRRQHLGVKVAMSGAVYETMIVRKYVRTTVAIPPFYSVTTQVCVHQYNPSAAIFLSNATEPE